MASSDSEKLSFSKIIKDIDLYFSKKLEDLLQKIPSFLKESFLGIPLGIIIILFLMAFAGQLRWWGNAFPGTDQQYYLFSGGQILNGKIPYIGFWDCKPVGLFLLYAFLRLFEPYQYYALPIFSSFFLFLGSLGLYCLARFFASKLPAFCASFSFILINISNRNFENGQSEQFFIPLVIWAITLIFLHFNKIQSSLVRLFCIGCASMLLFGITIEVKPSCVFEGILTGLLLLLLIFMNKTLSFKKRAFYSICFGLLWIFIALLPTLMVIAWYAEHHYLNDWIFANLQSNPKRIKWISDQDTTSLYMRHLIGSGIFLICFLSAVYVFSKQKTSLTLNEILPYGFIILWTILTFVSGTIIRAGFHSLHYLLPSVPPFLIFLVILWKESISVKLTIFLTFITASVPLIIHTLPKKDNERANTFHYLQKLARQQPGCLFQLGYAIGNVYQNLTKDTENCLVTKYLFPDTLYDPQYRFALPINPETEIRSILSQRPLYLILPLKPEEEEEECSDNHSWCIFPNQDDLWEENRLPEHEKQLLKKTLEDYTPLYLLENEWGFYKLRPGLTPGITPPNIKAVPSLPVQKIALPQKPNKKLERLKKIVTSWPAG